ncbi:hypothetical protein QTP88_002455 [Uroleucon formosanum]
MYNITENIAWAYVLRNLTLAKISAALGAKINLNTIEDPKTTTHSSSQPTRLDKADPTQPADEANLD